MAVQTTREQQCRARPGPRRHGFSLCEPDENRQTASSLSAKNSDWVHYTDRRKTGDFSSSEHCDVLI